MNQNTSNAIQSRWVIGRYTGTDAKRIVAHGEAGIGYYILDKPENGTSWVEAAHQHPMDAPLPDYLREVTNSHLANKLDSRQQGRQ